MAGRVGWWAGSGGGLGGRSGMDLRSKECSGVNIVTLNLRRIFNHLRKIFDFAERKVQFYVGKKYHHQSEPALTSISTARP